MSAEPSTTAVDFPVGGRLGDAALASLDGRADPPPAPRLASTVMLVRHGSACPVEVFMLRRVPTMEFAPSMWVFPGGGVDARDADAGLPWAGPSPAEWAARIGVDEPTARQLVIAAVREVFEECGVLLAGADADRVVGDVSGDEWQAEREALLSREQSFAQLLSRRRLVLRSDLLTLQDHWLTPEFEPKRYDTYFFAALLPEGQIADDATTEADTAVWVDPKDLLAQADSREARMLPPTVVNVRRVAGATSPEELVAARPTVVRVMPEPVRTDGGVVLRAYLPDR
ncbi:NUDIX domain-containing protein [Luteipulveratus sp. YIM 133132]|uniref:NUDIX hydrolase n=1 Tax=Luteipulveratus flavus TaxID=3031728 RepID=UPI0023AEF52D|nr:NUDIX domain-containing protein [Luteipulveratus sp. YIM 133132]MDE9365742.1 NUDIX domain-containing protein [Luteipulveratus sp. YIM 133132]